MITFPQLIAASFHLVDNPAKERADEAVFEGTERRIAGFESGADIQLYRHDALDGTKDYYAMPLYMLYNPERDSCLLATTPVPFRDKHFLTETAEAYTAEQAFQKVAAFFSGANKKVIPTEVF
ncbi:hypothetical protein [Hymenobacter psoromatis]|uniref:hypothetical protein n=1 Tax=Hymenobacter psoromatis TaxID=1484116 RepID=UPI001CBFDB70|nr:hypothetical protein [Hymenobacter psoromatis]